MSQPIRIAPRATSAPSTRRGTSSLASSSSAAAAAAAAAYGLVGSDHYPAPSLPAHNQLQHIQYPSTTTHHLHTSYPQSLPANQSTLATSSFPAAHHYYYHNRHHSSLLPPPSSSSSSSSSYTCAATVATTASAAVAYTPAVGPSSYHTPDHISHHLSPHFPIDELGGELAEPNAQDLTPEDLFASSTRTTRRGAASADPATHHWDGEVVEEGQVDGEQGDNERENRQISRRPRLPPASSTTRPLSADPDSDEEPFVPPHVIADRLYAQNMSRSLNPKKIPKLSRSFLL